MSKTSMEIDDDKLDQVREVLGTGTKRETVDAALDAVIARHRREQLVEMLRRKDGTDLGDPEIMGEAWR